MRTEHGSRRSEGCCQLRMCEGRGRCGSERGGVRCHGGSEKLMLSRLMRPRVSARLIMIVVSMRIGVFGSLPLPAAMIRSRLRLTLAAEGSHPIGVRDEPEVRLHDRLGGRVGQAALTESAAAAGVSFAADELAHLQLQAEDQQQRRQRQHRQGQYGHERGRMRFICVTHGRRHVRCRRASIPAARRYPCRPLTSNAIAISV